MDVVDRNQHKRQGLLEFTINRFIFRKLRVYGILEDINKEIHFKKFE